MSLQTEWMRRNAEKQIYSAKDDDGYFGTEYVNHPTPSGCERWLPTYSDKRRFDSCEKAILEFKHLLAWLENKIDTGYKDKNGKKIYLGEYAITFDREGNEWVGKISTNDADGNLFKNNGIYVSRVFVFKSNMSVWLHSYWTEKKLEIVEPTEKIIKKYYEQKNLKWGYYYSKKTLRNYYK